MMAVATFLLVAVLVVSSMVGYRPGTYAKAVFLASLAWGVLSNLIGIRVVDGWRHLALNTVACAAIDLAALAIAVTIAHGIRSEKKTTCGRTWLQRQSV